MSNNPLEPKLSEDVLYFGDNGRIFCGSVRCSGATAHFTGRGISGQKVEKISWPDAGAFQVSTGSWPACELCGKEMKR